MTFIGIDPGKKGAIAIIYEDGAAEVAPMDAAHYRTILACVDEHTTVCALERVSARPGQGVVSMFSFGESYGYLQGLLDAYQIPYELVTPQRWKKAFEVTGDKNSSIAVAKRLFPGVSLLRTVNSRKDDDGMAEALLLAEYARRTMGGAR